jgi:hypothetical protein
MRVRSEYALMSQCIEDGIEMGYARAFKHTDDPEERHIKDCINIAVLEMINETFIFDKEEYEA